MGLDDVTVDNPCPENPVIVEQGFETPENRLQSDNNNNNVDSEELHSDTQTDTDVECEEQKKSDEESGQMTLMESGTVVVGDSS